MEKCFPCGTWYNNVVHTDLIVTILIFFIQFGPIILGVFPP